MKYKTLETERLLLRRFESDDLDFIFHHFGDKFVSEYLYDSQPPRSCEEARGILGWCRGQYLYRGTYYDHNLWARIFHA